MLRAVALALAFMLAVVPAAAQTPDAERRGAEVAQLLLAKVDFGPLLAKEMADAGKGFTLDGARPEYASLVSEALAEEIAARRPLLEQLIGRQLARRLTGEELDVGRQIAADPVVQQMIATAANGGTPDLSRASPALQRLVTSPAGVGFVSKLSDFNVMMQGIQVEFVVAVMPGALRRMADKMEASERTRAAR